MSIYLDRTKDSNTIRFLGEIPEDADDHHIIADFVSEYDQNEVTLGFTGTQEGNWIEAILDNDDFPLYNGNYVATLHDTEEGFLTLNEITMSLNEITETLSTLRGPRKDNILVDKILVQVVGDNNIAKNTTDVEQLTSENASTLSRTQTQIASDIDENTGSTIRSQNSLTVTRTSNNR